MPIQPLAGIYRPEIDGLRAVAVLSVILFHINPQWLPGGFVGVDIFFVISGYLITGILVKELSEHRFTVMAFYERRMRRILPALWALLLVCLPISYWLMLPADAEAAGKSALWSILAMANIYFWREVSTDYFAPESGQMPFLHLWSLGVEEQFYLLWPVALLLIYALWSRRAREMAGGLAVAVVILSTVIAERQISKLDVRFAYYMLPARAGELAIGAALALTLPLMVRHFRARRGFDQNVALTGWGLLLASLLYLSESNPFPGWRALPPTLGAAFLIVAGQTGSSGSLLKPLCHPASLWVGRSSYSAYLWHWPILAWWRYLWGQPTATEGTLLLVGILLIGGGSQRWIEEPTRRARVSLARTLSLYLGLPAVLIGIMALLIARGEHWGFRLYPPTQLHGWQTLKETNRPVHQLDWVCQQHILDSSTLTSQKCEFGGHVP